METAKANVQKKADFEAAISLCKSEGIEWYETSKDVIDLYQPKGLGTSGFFIYKDIKVCEHGQAAKLEDALANPPQVFPDAGRIAGTKTRVKVLSKDSIDTLEVEK